MWKLNNALFLGGLAVFVGIALVGRATVAHGAYVLVDNFDSYAAGADIHTANSNYTQSSSTTGVVKSAADVTGAQSQVLQISNSNAGAYVARGGAFNIADGSAATLFFQYIPLSDFQDSQIGAGNSTAASFAERAGLQIKTAYPANQPTQHLGQALDGTGSYNMALGNIYNVYVVIHNAAGGSSSSALDTYDLYEQFGNGALSTIATGVAFRGPGDQSGNSGSLNGALTSLNFSVYNGVKYAIDNVYIDTNGQNLTNPVPEPTAAVGFLLAGAALLRRRSGSLAR